MAKIISDRDTSGYYFIASPSSDSCLQDTGDGRGISEFIARLRVAESLFSGNGGKLCRKWLLNGYLVSVERLVSGHLRVCHARDTASVSCSAARPTGALSELYIHAPSHDIATRVTPSSRRQKSTRCRHNCITGRTVWRHGCSSWQWVTSHAASRLNAERACSPVSTESFTTLAGSVLT